MLSSSLLLRTGHLMRSAGRPSGILLSAARQLPVTSTTAFSTSQQRASQDHGRLWSAERVVSAALLPASILPFLYTTPATDALFCTLAVLHSHWGIEAIVVDYIRPSLFGGSKVIPNIAVGLVWASSAFVLGALYYFNYTDVGLVNAIKMLWSL